MFDGARNLEDPGLYPERLAASGAVTAPRPRRRPDWIGWTDRAASFAAGVLVVLVLWLLLLTRG
jgi:hypothetical protein